jgi:hypothetical protein
MTSIKSLAPCTRRNSRRLQVRGVMALAAMLAIAPTSLLAEAQVQGSAEAVRIETQNSSIEEVLAALGNAFDVRYRSSANLAKQLSGTYEGSLQRVVARVLEGYDFVLRNNKGKIEITVLGTRNAAAPAAVASTASPAVKATPSNPPASSAPAPTKPTEQPASTPPPSPPSSTATKVAEGPQPLPFSDPAKFAEMSPVAAPMPGPMPGPAPIPEAPGEAPVPVPLPSSGPAPFPEPMPMAVPVPMPQANPGSIAVPMPGPAAAPVPANAGAKSPG